MTEEEITSVRKNCTHFLYGHGKATPKKYFAQMAEATCANEHLDHYGEGQELQAFESELADLLGHPSCLFFQSGTMAQLIAARIVTDQKRNSLIGFHPTCHLEIHEHHAYQKLHGLKSVLIGDKDQVITLQDLQDLDEVPAFVLLELPQREIGGQLPAWDALVKQVAFLKSKGAHVHMDGARLWESRVFYKKSLLEIAKLFDSVYVSFYKGIGAIAGAALFGSEDFIQQAKVWNRRHGGNLTTAFPLYISARESLKKRIDNFESYYQKTLEIAGAISSIDGLTLIPETPQVNMFHLLVQGNEKDLATRAVEIAKDTSIWGLHHASASQVGGTCRQEWYIGDGAMQIPTPEIAKILSRWVGR